MVEETSIEGLQRFREGGNARKYAQEVCQLLKTDGPMTANEFLRALGKTHISHKNYIPVFTTLEKRGVLRIIDKRPCRVTGRTVYVWEYTGNDPYKPPFYKKNAQIITELEGIITGLEATIIYLKCKLRENNIPVD